MPRIQIKRIEISVVDVIVMISEIEGKNIVPRNKTLVRSLIIRIFAYSAIKINANPPALYSTLNPDTSSDSPSAKSNGVRLVSARIEVNQIIVRRGSSRAGQVICVCFKEDISNVNVRRGMGSKIKIILTSYEIVCATLRRAPRSAYFELEAHPAPKVV